MLETKQVDNFRVWRVEGGPLHLTTYDKEGEVIVDTIFHHDIDAELMALVLLQATSDGRTQGGDEEDTETLVGKQHLEEKHLEKLGSLYGREVFINPALDDKIPKEIVLITVA